jgi:hypothetical protein
MVTRLTPFPVVATGLVGISVSSIHDPHHSSERIRLNYSGNREGAQSWVPASYDEHQWVQLSSQIPLRWVYILTQGRGDHDSWVTSFTIEYLRGNDWVPYNNRQVFLANYDRNTVIHHNLEEPLIAYAIRMKIIGWNEIIAMRCEAYVSDDVTENSFPKVPGSIPAIESGMNVTASSIWAPSHDTSRIRLNFGGNREGSSSWCAATNSLHEWVQVSSLIPKRWVKISTQGRGDVTEGLQFVTSYRVLYSLNARSWFYADNGRIFIGNSDNVQVVTHLFDEPFLAKIVRLEPVTANNHISLRMEIYYTEDLESFI